MDTRDHRKLWAIVMLAGSLGLMATMRSWHQDGQDSYTLVAQDSPLLGESLELEPLSAAVPYWAYASRFLKTNSQVWTPRPEIRTLANDSMAEQKEDEFAYSHFFYGRGGGTFLEIGAFLFLLPYCGSCFSSQRCACALAGCGVRCHGWNTSLNHLGTGKHSGMERPTHGGIASCVPAFESPPCGSDLCPCCSV